jgi:hypothetical protein
LKTTRSTADDLGNDTLSLAKKGIPVKLNVGEGLMHNKVRAVYASRSLVHQ